MNDQYLVVQKVNRNLTVLTPSGTVNIDFVVSVDVEVVCGNAEVLNKIEEFTKYMPDGDSSVSDLYTQFFSDNSCSCNVTPTWAPDETRTFEISELPL